MLIQIIHIFYYQGNFMFLILFYKKSEILKFSLLNIFYFKATNGSP